MKYTSTRGGVRNLTFEDALFTGYATDGGILVPDKIPVISKKTLVRWSKLGFVDLAKEIVPLFVPETEVPRSDLNDLLDAAFRSFSVPEIAPIARLQDRLCVLELYHGKTWAFKDLALSCVGQLYNYFCAKNQRHYTILVGTSGDTGSAAIEAVRGLKWVDIVVLLPKGRCSSIQEKQMTTVLEDNVHVYRVDGTSDDLDLPIKACFLDNEFVKEHRLTSINSINWTRIMVQMVHYFYSYFQMCPGCEGEVEIVIPTGACGNATSGCFARAMGLPIKLVCAVTSNDIVARAIKDGDFSMASEVFQTLAPAMDIQIPYNMERLWYIFSKGDEKLVDKLMREFEETKSVSVPKDLSEKISEAIVDTFIGTDTVVKATMKKVWDDNSYLVCPHTALAVAYHYQAMKNGKKDIPRICIATASVDKFKEAAKEAGLNSPLNPKVTALETMPTRYIDMDKGQDWEYMLRQKIIQIESVWTK